jgi:Cu/Ag efflux pump CusA
LLLSVVQVGQLAALPGSPLHAPPAWAGIGGLVSSSLLSRIVIPAVYLRLLWPASAPQ